LCFIFMFTVLCFQSLMAQDSFDLSEIRSNSSFGSTVKNSDLKITFSDLDFKFTLPVKINDQSILLFNISPARNIFYINNSTNFNHSYYEPLAQNGIWTLNFNPGYLRKFNDHFQALFLFTMGIKSDLETTDGKTLRYGGAVLFTKKYSDQFKLKYGLYFNQEYFGPYFVPLLGFDWRLSDKWWLYGLLPGDATLDYKTGQHSSAGLTFQAESTTMLFKGPASYRNVGDFNSSQTAIPIEPQYHSTLYLEKLSQELYLYYETKLVSNIFLNIKAGRSFFRTYRIFYAQDKLDVKISAISIGDNRKSITSEVSDGYMAEMKLIYRLPVK
ncbi:MAG: DUF6268 family outer membrane beta-barrel protein, partial [Bacteroidia bacterium]|nr:DUF6268 family outer membrane beta-barrel protein [Bacteroidia bacterium]